MRPVILFLDTNILLDCPNPREYRMPGRQLTLVVIPEVMRELHGLARSPDRGQAGAAMQALAALESLAQRRSSGGTGSGATFRVMRATSSATANADSQLVLRARAEQSRHREALVAVATRDVGVSDLARAHRVKSILIRGVATPAELERGVAEHDAALDIDL